MSLARITYSTIFLFFIFLFFIGCSSESEQPTSNIAAAGEITKEFKDLRDAIKMIEPFFKPMGKPSAYDWLASHNEPGQTFDEYLDSNPVKPTTKRQKIYVLPLGKFTYQQKKIIDITAGYLETFYDLPVQQMPPRQLQWPARFSSPYASKGKTDTQALSANSSNFRQNRLNGIWQIRTGYILDDILKPILPADAAALIAFTDEDLFPDETMNYVFGQASLENRVGIWSLSRLDDNADYDTFLRRTIKVAAHETGHMFSMRHCKKYECVMSGTNHLAETDSRPIDACPECTAKICWLSDIKPAERYKRLADFCRKNGLTKEADDFDQKADVVSKNPER